jgi:hypothetical protein
MSWCANRLVATRFDAPCEDRPNNMLHPTARADGRRFEFRRGRVLGVRRKA